MKTLSISLLLFAMFFSGCENDSDAINGRYNSMHFERMGGGQIDFNLYLTNNADELKAIVTKYSFRDTTIEIIIDYNADNATAFSSFKKAMEGETQINGDFKQSALPTGTWSYIYFVANAKETEVTNTQLRDSLIQFEQIVRERVQ